MRGQTTAVLLVMLLLGCEPMKGDDGGYEMLGDAATSSGAGHPPTDGGAGLTDAGDTSEAVTDGGRPDGSALFGGGSTLPACTRYVGKSGTVNGVLASRTIQGGLDSLVAGDTLCVAPGRYHEAVSVPRSGTATRVITIRALDPANKPVIDGEYTLPAGPAVNINHPFYSFATCVESWVDPNANLGPSPRQACFTFSWLVKITASHVVWDGIDVTRSRGLGVLIGAFNKPSTPLQGVAFRNSEISHIRDMGAHISYITGVSFHGNRVHDTNDLAAYSRRAPDVSWEAGIPSFHGGGPGWKGGLYLRGSDDVELTGNVIFHNWGEGLGTGLFDHNTQRTLLKDNQIYDNMSSQLYLTNSSHVVTEKNLVYHTGDPTYWLNAPGWSSCVGIASEDGQFMEDLLLKNNILAGCAGLISFNQYRPESRVVNIRMYNNTFLGLGLALRTGSSALNNSGLTFVNNLIASKPGTLPTFPGMEFHHNLWSVAPQSAEFRGPGDITTSNPGLALQGYQPSPGRFDLRSAQLLPSSAAINSGTPLAVVPADFFGARRPSGSAFDIGAHEWRP